VDNEIVKALSAFLDACYLARRADITETTLTAFKTALNKFYTHREIFRQSGVRPVGFSLPRQHSLSHYPHQMEDFGAPGGVCSSITESRHITTVKKPWRRSNRYEALGQMLLTNQRLDKLAAARIDFVDRGMLPPIFRPQNRLAPKINQDAEDLDDNEEDQNCLEMVEGNVILARTRSMFFSLFKFLANFSCFTSSKVSSGP
jgi:hypothetical protein